MTRCPRVMDATIRRVAAALVATVTIVAMVGVGPASADLPVGSDEDITAPQVTSMSVNPLAVDVTDGSNKTFTATLVATDDLSGLSTASASYRNTASGQYVSFSFSSYNRTAGDATNGTYGTTATVTPLTANGTYTLSSIRVYDTVGNYRNYYSADNVAPASLTVTSNADAVPPTITGVTVAPSPLDVNAGIQAAVVEVLATDDLSGLNYVFGQFTSPSGRQAAGFGAYPVATEPGVARGEITVARYSEPGDWVLDYLCAYDKAGNQRCFTDYSTPTIGATFPLAVSVISNPSDGAIPAVSAFRVSPAAGIDVTDSSQNVTTAFDVSDALSGVQYAYIRFASPRTAGASPEVIQRYGWAWAPDIYSYEYHTDGTYTVTEDESKRLRSGTISATTLFPRYDRSGDWQVAEVCIVDNVNWHTCYNTTTTPSLTTLGPTTLTVEWNRTPAVAVTGVTQASYIAGTEPAPGCDVSDVEDGVIANVSPVVTGPDTEGIVTVRCSYTDTGGLTGTATKTYEVVTPSNTAPSVSVTGVTQASYIAGTEPTPGCGVSDVEDGVITNVSPVVTGPDTAGIVTVRCSYTDTGGLTGTAAKTYEVVTPTNTAPSVSVTGVSSLTYEFGFEPTAGCSVVDAEDVGELAMPTMGPVTGLLATYGLGTVLVTCSYTDGGGLSASASVTYSIVDTTDPVLSVAAVSVWATGSSGATVAYPATATDSVDPAPVVSCTPPSGATFPIGATTVNCTATDVAGNSATDSFTVTVLPSCTAGLLRAPINADGSSVFKIGSTVPLKIVLSNCFGTTPDQVAPQVSLKRLDTTPDGAVNEVLASGAANEGTTMRYDGTSQHIYNLSTKRSQFCSSATSPCLNGDLTAGTYRVTITAPQLATPVTGTFNLRK